MITLDIDFLYHRLVVCYVMCMVSVQILCPHCCNSWRPVFVICCWLYEIKLWTIKAISLFGEMAFKNPLIYLHFVYYDLLASF